MRDSKWSRRELTQLKELEARVRAPSMAPVPGSAHVLSFCAKGGDGKTTTAAILGLMLSELRGEIVTVVGGNVHLDTLRKRLVPLNEAPRRPFIELCERATEGDIAPEWSALAPYSDMNGRLRVLTNTGADPESVELLEGAAYSDAIALLRRAAQIVISDMGTSLVNDVAVAALDSATTLVIPTTMALDSLENAIEMASALYGDPVSFRAEPEDYGSVADGRYRKLVERAVVVISPNKDGRSADDFKDYVAWFSEVCQGGVHIIPRDPHLASGKVINLSALAPSTYLEFMRVAVDVADQFRQFAPR